MKNFIKAVLYGGSVLAVGGILYNGLCRLLDIQPARLGPLVQVNKYNCCEKGEKEEKKED